MQNILIKISSSHLHTDRAIQYLLQGTNFYLFFFLLTYKTSIRYSCFQEKLTNHSIVQNGFLKLQSTPKSICSVYRYDEFTLRGQM